MAENSDFEKRLRADLTTSMKAKNSVRTGTLRMLISAVIAEKVSGKEAHELSDDDILKVLAKESKKRGESAQIYIDNGRQELADKEVAEAAIIDEYLPTPLSDDELGAIVDTAIAQVTTDLGEPPAMRQMGQVMKIATGLAEGKADGSRISGAVKARLS
ncbi:GatB/YqeY domain-containing protein [Rhodococcoides trifolii]|nr:GatB/YqeY domain-containing protein [Rhodococcus trifolii]